MLQVNDMLGVLQMQPVSLECSQQVCALLLEVPLAAIKQYQAQDVQRRSLHVGPSKQVRQA